MKINYTSPFPSPNFVPKFWLIYIFFSHRIKCSILKAQWIADDPLSVNNRIYWLADWYLIRLFIWSLKLPLGKFRRTPFIHCLWHANIRPCIINNFCPKIMQSTSWQHFSRFCSMVWGYSVFCTAFFESLL